MVRRCVGSSITPGCGLDVATGGVWQTRRKVPVHIQRPYRHLRSISSSPRPSGMPVTKRGCFVTSEEFSSRNGRRLDRVSAADRPQRHEALQSARSRASSVDGLLRCEFARFCARRAGGTCRRSPARVSGEGRLALPIAPAQARKKLVAAVRRAGHGPAPCDSGEQLAPDPLIWDKATDANFRLVAV